MQREYKYVMLANVEDLYDELFSDIILLQKEIIRILMMKIDNASEKSELLKVMYEIRYFYLLPVINNQRIKDVSKLKRLINMLNKKFFDKAYELKLINKICKQEEDSIDILKNIFLLQIISLEDAELKIAKNDDGYYVQFYEENIEDEAFKIESNLDKKDFKVRINKKIKVFE